MKSIFDSLMIVLLLSISILHAREDTEDAEKKAIKTFFPKTLVQEFNRLSKSKGLKKSGKMVESHLWSETIYLEAEDPAVKYILVAYSNMRSGAILLLKKNTNGFIEVFQDLKLPIEGVYYPEFSKFDLFEDGRSEIVVTFTAHVSIYKSYVLKWDGKKLKSVGPEKGFSTPTYEDINGDGLPEVLEDQEYDDKHPDNARKRIYSFKNGKYASTGEMNELIRVGNDEDEKSQIDAKYDFKVPDTKTAYVVRIENGNLFGERKTGESQVLLNGTVIAGPGQFKARSRFIDIPVTLTRTENTIRVRMPGIPLELLTITVQNSASLLPVLAAAPENLRASEALIAAMSSEEAFCPVGYSQNLIMQGASTRFINANGLSAIARAAHTAKVDCAKLLLANGGDPNLKAQTPGSRAPLMLAIQGAAYHGLKRWTAEILIEKGADVNVTSDIDIKGNKIARAISALEMSAMTCQPEIVKMLLSKGAKPVSVPMDSICSVCRNSEQLCFDPANKAEIQALLGSAE